ncbi:PEP-CTERM sorting domain-containing protein [Paucibacter sp. KBW04]|uniref:PEP-CTERM sorting domain-containing protein n=1 Tax=Paucibacter sp. KBW04 TaxID=2153361 RepID=UPI000F56B8EB|nr:PEP-CTERM sorting domain-containing protein [Paucibacter sp. KBW04]
MKLHPSLLAAAAALLAAQAGATTINFDDLAEGDTLSNQYAGLGVTFTPNAFSGAGSSGSGMDWASNTDMTITHSVTGDVGSLGSPPLVSGMVLHSFGGWFGEDGDPSFSINFAAPIKSISMDFAGVTDFADTRIFVYNGATLVSTVAGSSTGQFTLSYSGGSFTSVVVAAGSFDDWVAVDNINFTAAAVPEPASYALMALGLSALGLMRRRRD